MKLNLGRDLYLKGRIGWKGLSKDEYRTNSDYKIINATALMDGYVDWNNCGFITKDRYEESPEIMLQEGDILISKDGTLGKIGYVKGLTTPCTVASGIFVLRNSIPEKLNFDYLYHVLKSNIFKDFIQRNKSLGSTILHLYQRDLENFELELPSMEHQRSISGILNAIEDKIANNNKINAELESLAKTIYDYWFLQFEFPNEEGKPYKSLGGKMVWNEELKREIPEGWAVKKLNSIANLYQPEILPSNLMKEDGNYFVYGANGIVGRYNKFNHEQPEIAICCRGASCGNYLMTLPRSWITGNSMVVTPKDSSVTKEYLYHSLRYIDIKRYVTGSAQPQITRSNLDGIKVVIPPLKSLELFSNKAEKIRNELIKNINENNELSSLRDFLLPMLMNGQVQFK